jgi:hypothetical protein
VNGIGETMFPTVHRLHGRPRTRCSIEKLDRLASIPSGTAAPWRRSPATNRTVTAFNTSRVGGKYAP